MLVKDNQLFNIDEQPKSRFNQQYLKDLGEDYALRENEQLNSRTRTYDFELENDETENSLLKLSLHPSQWEQPIYPVGIQYRTPDQRYFTAAERITLALQEPEVINARTFGGLEYSDQEEMIQKYMNDTSNTEIIFKNHLLASGNKGIKLMKLAEQEDEEDVNDEDYDYHKMLRLEVEQLSHLHEGMGYVDKFSSIEEQRKFVLEAGKMAIVKTGE